MPKHGRKHKAHDHTISVSDRLAQSIFEVQQHLGAKRFTAASELLRRLADKHPNHPAVVTERVNFCYDTGDMRGYLDACEQLAAFERSSAEIQFALAGAYFANTMPALAQRHFRRCLRRWPVGAHSDKAREAVSELEPIIATMVQELQVDAADALELLCLHEEIQQRLHQGQYGRVHLLVEQLLRRKPDFVPALNNDAMASFQQGQLERALATTRRALQIMPDNFHALSGLVRMLFLTGRHDDAHAVGQQLKAVISPNQTVWVKKAEALSLLGDDCGVLELWRAGSPTLERMAPDEAALFCHYSAVALFRMGHEHEGLKAWRLALQRLPSLHIADDNLRDSELAAHERHGPWPFGIETVMPKSVLLELTTDLGSKNDKPSEETLRQLVRQRLAKRPEMELNLAFLVERGDAFGRNFAFRIAALARPPKLLDALLKFAQSQNGSDKQRSEAAQILSTAGVLKSKTLKMWFKGEQRDIRLLAYTIHGEAKNSLAGAHDEQLRISELLGHGKGHAAEPLVRALIQRYPDEPALQNNLAMALQQQGKEDEAVAIMRETHKLFFRLFIRHHFHSAGRNVALALCRGESPLKASLGTGALSFLGI